MNTNKIITKTKEASKLKKKSIQKWPKVAIIILNWNGWKDTIECLESVFRNTYPNYQAIVVDNGSTDGSMEKIKDWADGKQEVLTPEPNHPLYHLSHPPIDKPIPYVYYIREEAEKGGNFNLEEKVTKEWQEQRKYTSKELNPTSSYPLIFIQTGENLGFAGGNNVGIRYRLERGDFNYIWLLNNDTVVDQNALLEMVKLPENDEKIGMLGSIVLFYDNHDVILEKGGGSLNLNTFNHASLNKDNDMWNKSIEPDYITGSSMLVKKLLIDRIGLLDEAYFMYIEDIDWSIKVKNSGYKFYFSYKSRVWHKKGSSTGLIKNYRKFLWRKSFRPVTKKISISYYYNIRNKIYFVRKHFKSRFIIYCFIYTPFNILRLIIVIFVHNDNNKFKRIRLILKAWRDGIIGNMGKLIDVYHINI